MEQENNLIVVDQRDVRFYEDTLSAVKVASGDIFVSVRAMCNALEVDPRAQYRRCRRQRTLAKGFMVVKMDTIKGQRATNVLRIDLVPHFLAGISTKNIRDDTIRQKLERFQDNAAKVLWEAFQSGELSTDDTFGELLKQGGEAVEAYKLLQGMLKLAKNQILLQGRVQDNADRITVLEQQLGNPKRLISAEQAMHISQAVKTIALEMGKRSGRNEFQGVYGELYRRFKIPSYRELPAQQYDPAMNFLRDWYSAVVGGDVPF